MFTWPFLTYKVLGKKGKKQENSTDTIIFSVQMSYICALKSKTVNSSISVFEFMQENVKYLGHLVLQYYLVLHKFTTYQYDLVIERGKTGFSWILLVHGSLTEV